MTEQTNNSSFHGERSPGALLRAARERRGMHIAALAAAIKVAPARLEALEADDYSAMPDTTFARALAQAVCRALKVDPTPVLALMPDSFHSRLERVDEGLNAPFRERPGGFSDSAGWAPWRYPVVWLALLLLVGAAAFVWWPRPLALAEGPEALPPGAEPISTPLVVPAAAASVAMAAASAGTEPAGLAGAGVSTAAGVQANALPQGAASVPSAAAPPAALPSSSPSAALPVLAVASTPVAGAAAAEPADADGVVVRAVQDTWVQVTDGAGKVLSARTIVAGETLTFTGRWPMKLRIGNVQGTDLAFRGRPIDLKALTKDNTVSLVLPSAANP